MAEIILVDENDNQIGTGEKLEVHRQGKLHRAFSVLIFNPKGELLLQKRAKSKYHSGGLWSNTCCSHPTVGERIKDSAERRLFEEMGIKTKLKEIFSFVYKAKFEDLTEYEFDHVFEGRFNGNPNPEPEEAEDWKWMNLAELKKDIKENPKNYTEWFKIIIETLENI